MAMPMGLTVRFVGARWLTPPPEDKAQTLCVWNGMPDVRVIRTIRSELEARRRLSDVYRAEVTSVVLVAHRHRVGRAPVARLPGTLRFRRTTGTGPRSAVSERYGPTVAGAASNSSPDRPGPRPAPETERGPRTSRYSGLRGFDSEAAWID